MADARDIEPLLDTLVQGLITLYGKRFVELTLFGSYARGEADEESDVDLLLRLRGPVDVLKEIRRSDEVLWPLSLDYGLTISLIPVSADNHEGLGSTFLHQVEQEGVRIA